jgi:ADP-heptose:LPS heptosyltransferase
LSKSVQIEAGAKILALQFKNLGDAVMMIAALKAIHDQVPSCRLHALVREEAAPLLQNLPWITKVWTLPRTRGRSNFKAAWPVVRALRRERFQYAIDFATNDRTAILTFLSGAKERLGFLDAGGFLGRRLCFTVVRPRATYEHAEYLRLFDLLKGFEIRMPKSASVELKTDPANDKLAQDILKEPSIIGHLGASGPKKEWPVPHWAALFKLTQDRGIPMTFTSGQSPRERLLLKDLQNLNPEIKSLPDIPNLALFLSVLKRALVVVSGDTGPAHFAAGLGVPAVVLYGPTSAVRWAPLGPSIQLTPPSPCSCDDSVQSCHSQTHCLASITPDRVLESIQKVLPGDHFRPPRNG